MSRSTHQALVIIAGLVCVGVYVLATSQFLVRQSLWVDETTQLSGLTLGPVEVTQWLVGNDPHRFDVPPDRNPPVSYWVGSLWSSVFGLSEWSMRWLGTVCISISILIVFLTVHQLWGLSVATCAALLFALSPNAIVAGVEIRPYPLFVLFCSIGVCSLLLLAADDSRWSTLWLFTLVASCVLAMYAHFYGLVFAGAIMLALIAVSLFSKHHIRAIFISACITAASSIGLWPFVNASREVSGEALNVGLPAIRDIARFAYRSYCGHPSLTTNLVIACIAVAAFGALVFLSLMPKRSSNKSLWSSILVVVFGSLVVIGARFVIRTFDTLEPSYNLWRLPVFVIIIAAPLASSLRGIRIISQCLAITLIGSCAFATSQLIRHGDVFSHGPHQRLAHVIRNLQSDDIIIIHDDAGPWGHVYFPLRYDFHDQLIQYVATQVSGSNISLKLLPDLSERGNLQDIQSEYVVIIRASDQGWKELGEHVAGHAVALPQSQIVTILKASQGWRLESTHEFVAMYSANIAVFRQVTINSN